jgi:hypothetical protein
MVPAERVVLDLQCLNPPSAADIIVFADFLTP